jgi:5S rRNA maturation endonuclease (ribonuclease M5)
MQRMRARTVDLADFFLALTERNPNETIEILVKEDYSSVYIFFDVDKLGDRVKHAVNPTQITPVDREYLRKMNIRVD